MLRLVMLRLVMLRLVMLRLVMLHLNLKTCHWACELANVCLFGSMAYAHDGAVSLVCFSSWYGSAASFQLSVAIVKRGGCAASADQAALWMCTLGLAGGCVGCDVCGYSGVCESSTQEHLCLVAALVHSDGAPLVRQCSLQWRACRLG